MTRERNSWCTERGGNAGNPRSPRCVSSFRLKSTIGTDGCSSASLRIVGSSWHDAPTITYIPVHSAGTTSPPPDCLKMEPKKPKQAARDGEDDDEDDDEFGEDD